MPKIDGIILCQEIRKIDKRIKVCFITASEDYYIKQFLELKEEECFMQKPISTDSFVSRVKLALANYCYQRRATVLLTPLLNNQPSYAKFW